MSKKQLGQFFTKNGEYIVGNLLNIFPINSTIIDPFAGENDLLNLLDSSYNKIGYDIDPKLIDIIKSDSLLNPIDYTDKWILTNPPYLAKNKNKDKTIYEKYGVDDLYKASLKSIIGCVGGVIIVPLNFLSDEDNEFRKIFLSKYKIVDINIFEERVFADTDYTVCAFSFIREDNTSQIIKPLIYPHKIIKEFEINYDFGYTIGNEFNVLLSNYDKTLKIGRLLIDDNPSTNLFLRAVDTGSLDGKISLSINDKHFYGKDTDRVFASIISNRKFTYDEEILICEKFNQIIEQYREKYHSLFLTNYRNSSKVYARKRISFDIAYRLINHIVFKHL